MTDSIEATLGAGGDSWIGPFSSTSADPAGNVLFVGNGTVRAERMTVQPLATPAMGTPCRADSRSRLAADDDRAVCGTG